MVLSVVAFGAMWPVLLATRARLRVGRAPAGRGGRCCSMPRAAFIWKVGLPNALPDILAGMRLSMTVALILAIVGEMIASQAGLGQAILLAARCFRASDLFAGIVLLGADRLCRQRPAGGRGAQAPALATTLKPRRPDMTLPAIQRVVTGHDAQGKAIISSHGPLPVVTELKTLQGVVFHEVWNTTATPARIDNGTDPTLGPITLPPPGTARASASSTFRPMTQNCWRAAPNRSAGFSEIGDAGASTVHKGAPHPLMHRTQSVDYGIVIEGELTLIVDEGEVPSGPAAWSSSVAPTTRGRTGRARPAGSFSF